MTKTPKDILRDRAQFHQETTTRNYSGVITTRTQNSNLACEGCAWCRPEPEDWKAHDEAMRILRMTEKVK